MSITIYSPQWTPSILKYKYYQNQRLDIGAGTKGAGIGVGGGVRLLTYNSIHFFHLLNTAQIEAVYYLFTLKNTVKHKAAPWTLIGHCRLFCPTLC